MEVQTLFNDSILFSYKEDILDRGFWDWMKTYSSYLEPVHHYKGEIRLFDDLLEIEGLSSKKERTLIIGLKEQLTSIALGFDETYTVMEDRFGGMLYKPLKINLMNGNKEICIYGLVGYNTLMRNCQNDKWNDILLEWLHH